MSPDFDLNKSFDKGLKMRSIFVEILSFSASVFLAFQWQKVFNEIVSTFWIEGQNLQEKVILNAVLTIIVVSFVYAMLKWNKKKDKETVQ